MEAVQFHITIATDVILRGNTIELLFASQCNMATYTIKCTSYIHNMLSFYYTIYIQRALKEFVMIVDTTFGKQFDEFNVGFEGSFGSKHVTPRSLSSRLLGNMVCLEGIVTKCK